MGSGRSPDGDAAAAAAGRTLGRLNSAATVLSYGVCVCVCVCVGARARVCE